MISLSNIFKGIKEFKVTKCTEGQSDNFVTTLQASEAIELNGLKTTAKITLYISLTELLEVDAPIKLDSSKWNYFESSFEAINQDTGESREVVTKWLQVNQA